MAAQDTVTRNIYFYGADIGVDGSGRLLPFDPTDALRHIDNMPQHAYYEPIVHTSHRVGAGPDLLGRSGPHRLLSMSS